MNSVTAVIPAYNEANRIIHTLNQVKPFVDEIIVVDDASTDQTADLARQYGAKVLINSKNKGYIESIKHGFKEASGDIVITLDADGEFSSQYIPELIKPITNGYADMVQGHRDSVPRPSERVLTWLAQRKTNVGDSGTGLRAIRSDLAKTLDINGACICGVLSLEVALRGGRIVEIPISLQAISKPRKIAWFHLRQFFYLLPWLVRRFYRTSTQ
ncbi:MAG TPA: glycosyltransferase family 2 protein [Gammaproteobacteria bacterium]|nr:glycosyltransferase family 2 protein [Gammaproteobacteria bacterium]